MIRETLYIPKYDWVVHCYFAVSCYYTYEILDMMRIIGADREYIQKAHANLIAGDLDTGLTYSNTNTRETVWVTSLTSSADQFLNSLVHEIRHLQQHIANAYDIDENSEEVCYICGDIAQMMFPFCKKLLCDCCRTKQDERVKGSCREAH